LEDVKKRAEKAGLVPVVAQGKRKELMTRVHVGEFASQQAAKKTLDKLRSLKADPFVLQDKAGKLNVYSGSYSNQKAAVREQQRLAGMGISASLKQEMVSVPTSVLTAGCFQTEEAALKKVAELEKLGVKSAAVKKSPQ
jgi:cell division protein FtsN